jgi:hypothetical protein
MSQGTCSQCNAQYNSERELRDHMGRAHRKFILEPVQTGPSNPPANIAAAIPNLKSNT